MPVEGNATVSSTDEETLAALEVKTQTQTQTEAVVNFRQSIVNYALQFVGGRYAYGGSDPRTE